MKSDKHNVPQNICVVKTFNSDGTKQMYLNSLIITLQEIIMLSQRNWNKNSQPHFRILSMVF